MKCPDCHAVFNTTQEITRMNLMGPDVGDFGVCRNCASVFEFDNEMRPQPALLDTLREAGVEDIIAAARRAVLDP